MNPEVFGDVFCEALVQHCQELRTLTIKSLPPRVDPSMSLQQFTDASMRGLASLPQLHDVSLALQRRDFPNLVRKGATIGDIVAWEWCGSHHVRFRCQTEPYPLCPRTSIQFRRFCGTLVYNYPALVLPQNPVDHVQPRPPTAARWRADRTSTGLRLWMDEGVGIAVDLGIVTGKRSAARAARAAGQSVATFKPHPWFAQLWNLSVPHATPSFPPPPLSAAAQHVIDRTEQACRDDGVIGAALRGLSWHRVAHLKSSVSSQRLLLMKIKGLRLSGWSRSLHARGCPHCAALGPDGGHTFHIMWYCSSARDLWTILRRFWQRLGLWRRDTASTASSFLQAAFSVRLPATPVGASPFTARPRHAANPDHLHELMQQLWARHVLACFHTIWNWRQGVADAETPWNRAAAHSALRARLLSALHSTSATIDPSLPEATGLRHLLIMCRRLIPTARSPPLPSLLPQDAYVLFFDGGSRGNPGPGGAGSVIVRTDRHRTTPRVVWSAATSLAASTTTNNQAEYHDLVTGLAAAARSNWRPLDVVGDSMLIVRQLATYRPPKNAKLLALYREARSLADTIGVDRWIHHLRAYNKMADAAANVAMDTRRSIHTFHPTPRPEWAGLDQHLAGDFLHWQSAD